MTRIGTIGAGASTRRAARGASGFTLPAARDGAATERAAPVEAPTLLALQEQPSVQPAMQSLRQAESALDELRGLQLELLRGGTDSVRLARLATLAGSAESAGDPVLREAVAAVRLRARVELARRRAQQARAPTDASSG